MSEKTPVLTSVLTCPLCGHAETEIMPTNACQWFYECKSCHALLQPKEGDCCVFCSYASVPCPPVQLGDDAQCYSAKPSSTITDPSG